MASSYSAVVSADKLPKLTADNFVTWKTYITAALQERELWSYVDGTALTQSHYCQCDSHLHLDHLGDSIPLSGRPVAVPGAVQQGS